MWRNFLFVLYITYELASPLYAMSPADNENLTCLTIFNPASSQTHSNEHALALQESGSYALALKAFGGDEALFQKLGKELLESQNEETHYERLVETLRDKQRSSDFSVKYMKISPDGSEIRLHVGGGFYTSVDATPRAMREKIEQNKYFTSQYKKDLEKESKRSLQTASLTRAVSENGIQMINTEKNRIALEAQKIPFVERDSVLIVKDSPKLLNVSGINENIVSSRVFIHPGKVLISSDHYQDKLKPALEINGINYTEKDGHIFLESPESLQKFLDLKVKDKNFYGRDKELLEAMAAGENYYRQQLELNSALHEVHQKVEGKAASSVLFSFSDKQSAQDFAKSFESSNDYNSSLKSNGILTKQYYVEVTRKNGSGIYSIYYMGKYEKPPGLIKASKFDKESKQSVKDVLAQGEDLYTLNQEANALREKLKSLIAQIAKFHDDRRTAANAAALPGTNTLALPTSSTSP